MGGATVAATEAEATEAAAKVAVMLAVWVAFPEEG